MFGYRKRETVRPGSSEQRTDCDRNDCDRNGFGRNDCDRKRLSVRQCL